MMKFLSNISIFQTYLKVIFAFGIIAFSLFLWKTFPDISPGAKAALFALSTASMVLVGLLPDKPNEILSWKIMSLLMVRVSGCYLACSSGWFWLYDATDGNPGEIIALILPAFILPGTLIGITIINVIWLSLDSKR